MRALYDVAAPAKLNLFLHIVGRRDDGLHLLQSVFALIDWSDTLHFEVRGDGLITREDLTTPLPDDDLAVRAAKALRRFSGSASGVHIGLAKLVPAEAGMGGGSSDAASCLLALNRLWALNLPLDTLETIGLSLGADVPFFLRGHNAWVEGIGERITPIRIRKTTYAVVKPPAGLETRRIFAAPDLQRDTPAAILSGFAAFCEDQGDDFGRCFGRNDLQPVAEKLCPQVTQAIEWLGAQGLQGRMTGSGSSVFAAMPHEASLSPQPPGWQFRKCSSLDVHPLVGWAS